MKNILVDIGNSTHCKAAVTDGDSILSVRRIPRKDLRMVMEDEVSRRGPADVLCVSSVAGEEDSPGNWCAGMCRKYVQVSADIRLPLQLDYGTPGTLGADRIAAAAGAAAVFPGESCMIFDFGTALTVDYVTAGGMFSGGNISPGLSMRLKAMHEFTGRLPLVEAYEPVRPIGKTTAEALVNGTVSGMMFEVEKYIENNPGSRVIFTGGDAVFFAKMLKTPIFVVCNLVFIGLSKIAQLNG